MTSRARRLRTLLAKEALLTLPGAANALSARIIEDCDFEAVYVTGAGISNSFLGAPDIGLLTVSELTAHVSAIAEAVDIPVIVDADTGFGNALNMRRTVRLLEQSGASGFQIEDQTFPKRCGHFDDKDVIPCEEMVAKIEAAADVRSDDDTVIIARTDARAVLGLDQAVERSWRYREAGADVVFIEAPQNVAEVEYIAEHAPSPQVINMVHGGVTPSMSPSRLSELGFAIALYANLPLLASITAMQATLRRLRQGEEESADVIATWDERQRLVRRKDFAVLEQRFSSQPPGQRFISGSSD